MLDLISNFSFDYFFWSVAIGTMLLGLVAAVVGSSLVMERQSQLGDTLGHASLPGIILSFMIFQSRNPLLLLLGAVIASIVTFLIIQWVTKYSNIHYESIMALVLSGMFGLGMTLQSYIQGNPNFQGASQAGLDRYIFGQAAFLMIADAQTIGIVSVIVLLLYWILYPKIKIVLFDKVFAQAIGINTRWLSNLMLLMAIIVISVGLKAVGAILISSMLVAPTVAARQWTNKFSTMLVVASIVGLVSAFFGTFFSTAIPDLATGPTIVIFLSIFAIGSILIAPNGVLTETIKRWNKQKRSIQ